MTNSTDKIETRVDSAHSQGFGLPEAENPTADLLKSIAGLSRETILKQVCGQSIELAAHLQSKQKLLDRRESELNAKLAMLETEERANRIRFRPDESIENTRPVRSTTKPMDCGIELENDSPSARFADENRAISIETDDLVEDESLIKSDSTDDGIVDFSARHHPEEVSTHSNVDALRTSLADREQRLVERENQVERLHDQVTDLHRESLELRIATEQVWAALGKSVTDEQLAESISRYRARLVDHYKMTSDEISRRTRELDRMKESLRNQEGQIRRQRLDVQVWVDRQRDELDSSSAELAIREAEVNRREIEFQRQAILWQKQRDEYRRQIEQLSRRVREC